MATKTGKSYTSAGIHSNVKQSTLNAIKRDRSEADKIVQKIQSWEKGQNPWLTIENPNANETNKKFIRVNARSFWGDPNPKKE